MVLVCALLAVPGVLPRLDLLRLDENEIGAQGAALLADVWAGGTSDAFGSVRQLHLQV